MPAENPTFSPGSLVHVRDRDWVVLPSPEADVLRVRPLTGGDEPETGIFLPLEGDGIRLADFAPPDPNRAGDTTGCLLLQDAARLSLRAGAAPFRSLGQIAVVPRPYQFVPLIMALRQDPVRLLVADDVGVGKTIEAGLIARELLDRGIAKRLVVLCASHLCDQWERELREKFAIDAVVVQPSTVARLERGLPRADLSLYQFYPNLIVSIDYAKSDRNRGRFLPNAPDLVIVDEAHTAARPRGAADRSQHQRYNLLRDLADRSDRHLVLVTATPHSGIEESFRSLLGLLDRSLDRDGADDLGQRRLLPYVIQRRRSDLARWLGADTPFPERQGEERPYALSGAYHTLFEKVLAYCRETIQTDGGLRSHQRRVRHWAAIALLRCLLSSPAAAEAVLSKRARRSGESEVEELAGLSDAELDALYRPQVLDPLDEEAVGDYAPTAPLEDAEATLSDAERRRLAGFVRDARELAGGGDDAKLTEATRAVAELLRAGFQPIVFCRFIATATYLQDQLRSRLAGEFAGLQVAAVTGEIGDEERREKVDELARAPRRVLVATDCLSEGINLQEHFDAVLHYDLPWNPNRLEQREGRVDRFAQRKPVVRAILLYGGNNPVDLVVLKVLIEKARTIRQRLGVSVPVPIESEQVVQAVVESVLLQAPGRGIQLQMPLFPAEVSRLQNEWDAAAEREAKQRAFFAQHGIKPDEVARELEACDPVLGDATTVRRFLANTLQRFGGELRGTRVDGVFEIFPGELQPILAARGQAGFPLRVCFDALPRGLAGAAGDVRFVGRSDPIVATGCDAVLGAALSAGGDERFARGGAIFTTAVRRRTGVALLRLRYLLRERVDEFAEEVVLAAFERQNGELCWIEPYERAGRDLLEAARPVANLSPAERAEQVRWALDLLTGAQRPFAPIVRARVVALQDSQDRLRKLVRDARLIVQPHEPPDLLGCYVLVPVGGAHG